MSDIEPQRFMVPLNGLSYSQREDFELIIRLLLTTYGFPASVTEKEALPCDTPCSLITRRDRRRPIKPPAREYWSDVDRRSKQHVDLRNASSLR